MNSPLTLRLEAALAALVGSGALKDRLTVAWLDALEKIDAQELPEDVREDFAAMRAAMHSARALPGDSVVRASIRKFSNEQAHGYAQLIVRSYGLRMAALAAPSALAPVAIAVPVPARNAAATPRTATPLSALLDMDSALGAQVARAKRATGA